MVRRFQSQPLLLLPLLPFVSATFSHRNDRNFQKRKRDRLLQYERTIEAILPKDVSRAATAIRLAETVQNGHEKKKEDDDDRDGLENLTIGIYLESGIDAVYLARIGDDYCAAAFRGTTDHPGDWITNLYLGPVEFGAVETPNPVEDEDVVDSFAGCDVHRGYHEAYADFEYRESVEDFLRSCRSECPECETVLTGHSQGGGIAQIAALYQKRYNGGGSNATSVEVMVGAEPVHRIDDDYESPYVVTFAAPLSLGAGCSEVFSEDERRRWFRYIMATEGTFGNELVYDPIPMLSTQLLDPPPDDDNDDEGFFDNFDGFDFDLGTTSRDQTYARNGGLAFIGHEILLSTEDPSAVLLSEFDGHRYVDLKYIDLSGSAHYDDIYSQVLQAQDEIYNNRGEDVSDGGCLGRKDNSGYYSGSYRSFAGCPNTHIPSVGFAAGSLCNKPDESSSSSNALPPLSSTCAEGTTCEAESTWMFWDSARHTCQPSSPALPPAEPSEADTTTNRMTNSTTNQTTIPANKPIETVASMIASAPATSSGFRLRPLPTSMRQTIRNGHFMVAGAMLVIASMVC